MGVVFENLTLEELCDLMCGDPEDDFETDDKEDCSDEVYNYVRGSVR